MAVGTVGADSALTSDVDHRSSQAPPVGQAPHEWNKVFTRDLPDIPISDRPQVPHRGC